ncbi:hypothetical protein ACROYT_G007216 [Oculina patagonica]
MTSFLTLGVTVLLIVQVYGRPSKFPENRLANFMAYDIAKRVYKAHAFDTDKNDDSGYADIVKHRHVGGHMKEEDEVTRRDDSMFEEQAIPSESRHESHSFNDQMTYNEDRRLGVNENDDSSVKGYGIPFQNHQQAHANTDDDGGISEGHEILANHRGKNHNDLRDVFLKRAQPRISCVYCCRYISCAAEFDHICHCDG